MSTLLPEKNARATRLPRTAGQFARCLGIALACAFALSAGEAHEFPDIPADFLQEAESIPDFWVSEVDAIEQFLRQQVKRGEVEIVGRTAGGRPIRAVA
ncbi:MAG TPA: hypothetical protein VEA63_05530, partial [Opitutus sp.]|nr:hypothetical protein [Opitutus sp.]